MDNELLFLSGNEIPFVEAQVLIHNPTIKEISFIGEECFFAGREIITFSKNNLTEEDKVNLENQTDFDIIIAILKERKAVMQKNRDCVFMLLALLFPEYTINIENNSIVLIHGKTKEKAYITENNFQIFKNIFNKMFPFNQGKDIRPDFNPQGALAKKIADKLNRAREKVAKAKNETKKINILNRYISILAVGEQKDINELLNYTVYQLLDEFQRYELKLNYDSYFQAKMAGAQDLKEVEDWMQDIHE